jgi:hypothetical protein
MIRGTASVSPADQDEAAAAARRLSEYVLTWDWELEAREATV